jgi:hypothetical protein
LYNLHRSRARLAAGTSIAADAGLAPRNLLTLTVLAVIAAACREQPPPVAPDDAVLQRRTQALRRLAAAADAGPLVPFESVLVVVNDKLVQEVLAGAMPWDQVIAGRYRVLVTGAEVSFEDGFALIRLDGRVSLQGNLENEVFAEARLFAGMDVVELDTRSGLLRGKLDIIAFDARRVGLFGESEAGRELVEEFGRQSLEAFAAFASTLEIPVRLEKEMEVPAVGPEGPVSIPAATVPTRVALADVKVFSGRLWIAVDAAVGEAANGGGRPGATRAASKGPES